MKHRFSPILGVNTLFNGMLNHPLFKTLDFSHLKGAVGGGMAVQDTVAIQWQEVTGSPLVEGYGLSETSPVLCCNPLDGSQKRGTIGLPMPSTEVAIFDDDGQFVKQSSENSAQKEHRNKNGGQRNSHRDNGETDLARAVPRRLPHRLAQFHVPDVVFEHDYGVVNHETHR